MCQPMELVVEPSRAGRLVLRVADVRRKDYLRSGVALGEQMRPPVGLI